MISRLQIRYKVTTAKIVDALDDWRELSPVVLEDWHSGLAARQAKTPVLTRFILRKDIVPAVC